MNGIFHAEPVCSIVGKGFRVHGSHGTVLVHAARHDTETVCANEYSQKYGKKKHNFIDFFLVYFHISIILWVRKMSKRGREYG